MSALWPPLLTGADAWRRRRLRDGALVWVRRVVLWGHPVEVDADGLVLCPGCRQIVDVDELGRADTNTHAVGLRGGGMLPRLRPLGEDDAPAPPRWEVEGW